MGRQVGVARVPVHRQDGWFALSSGQFMRGTYRPWGSGERGGSLASLALRPAQVRPLQSERWSFGAEGSRLV